MGLVDVMHVPGLGPKTARKLWLELGVTSADELRAAAEQGRLRELPGLGPKSEERVLAHFAKPARRSAKESRVLLGRALPFVEAVVEELRAHPASVRVSEAGSVRRRAETVRDLDVIATATDAAALIDHFVGRPWVAEVAARGGTKATVVSHDGLRLDLRVVPPECFGNLLQHFTGSKHHNVALREDAVRRGLSVSEYGVETVETGEVATHASEEELYAHLGYAWIPPELRENGGELDAARDGGLPALVEQADVLGDLHTHTDWSDGKATLEDMVAAAAALGHRYLAVCDHARRLRDGRIELQAERIAELGESFPELRILSGVEVDIRADGSLDFPDEALAERDWVVASVHSGFQDSSEKLTKRILSAIDHPHVDCIGHPTGRKISRRSAYDIDLEQIFARAVETGTHLEINGSRTASICATPTRARRPRPASRSSSRAMRTRPGARLSRAGGLPGAPRLADRRSGREHRAVGDTRRPEASVSADFRTDGAAALEWAAGDLERVGELPVLPRLAPGALRRALPSSPPEDGEPFANVLRDLDELILPAVTHWQSPRFFGYFAVSASEPAILAELLAATLNQVAFIWRVSPASTELELHVLDWLAQLLGLPEAWHGHIEDSASTSTLAALIAARHVTGGNRVLCSEHAHSSVEKGARMLGLEVVKIPADGEFRMRLDALAAELERGGAAAVVATVGTTSSTAVDPVPEIAELVHEAGAWLHVDAAYAGSSWVCPELRWSQEGVELARLARREPAQVALRADGLLGALDEPARGLSRRLHARPGVSADERRGGESLGLRAGARPPLSLAQAVGGAALLRAPRVAGAHPRGDSARRALPGLGRRRAGLGALRPTALQRRLLPANGSDEENEMLLERVNAAGEIFISHTKLDGRYVLRLAVGNERTTEADVARAWDVLRAAAR